MGHWNPLWRLRRTFRRYVADKPFLYMPLARGLSVGTVVERDTALVIEGFPRSGNSFAEAAFRVAQASPVKLAHHCHAAAQVVQAARWGIPVLVILRDPLESCRSLIMHHPHVYDPELALSEYMDFHRGIRRARAGILVCRFEAVTADFGLVIDALNDKFSTAFARFEHNADNERRAFSLIDDLSIARGTSADGEAYTPGKSGEARARQKEEVRMAFETPATRVLLAEARSLYRDFLETADV